MYNTSFELRLKPYYPARASACSRHQLPRKDKVVRCNNSGCKQNINHSTIPHMVNQGAPLRCKECRGACWRCGSRHRTELGRHIPELCLTCQRTELLENMSAYDDGDGLPHPILDVAIDHIRRCGPGESLSEKSLSLTAALLRKAPLDHYCVPLLIADSEKAINTLRDLGVKEWVLEDFRASAVRRRRLWTA